MTPDQKILIGKILKFGTLEKGGRVTFPKITDADQIAQVKELVAQAESEFYLPSVDETDGQITRIVFNSANEAELYDYLYPENPELDRR